MKKQEFIVMDNREFDDIIRGLYSREDYRIRWDMGYWWGDSGGIKLFQILPYGASTYDEERVERFINGDIMVDYVADHLLQELVDLDILEQADYLVEMY